jgi:arylsulfatase
VPTWELYHLGTDRSEQHDLAAEKPELVRQLAAEWNTWAREVGVELPRPPDPQP